ncbi:hypothetical protein BKA70DRAFT_1428675 [Coprinopsis sp. MPI-PUGE-AT-0042]|nr:hypothetical protein BKA70DRAFT_1450559 [Coprinopsis sp. MPI-PUGE-AT-0042]KAH6884295.1 hypothetical protein BKA70DRAFT_1445895 [Coprinopsis sp. MPI-PUGE-AT-0042]KAH6906595.1 hypothetical protein BKA70DRAFT_1428675 [Coprinopsis sp. MPI-PUGE-AT-0042]
MPHGYVFINLKSRGVYLASHSLEIPSYGADGQTKRAARRARQAMNTGGGLAEHDAPAAGQVENGQINKAGPGGQNEE